MTTLTTKQMILRPAVPDDRAHFIGLERDRDVMRYLSNGPVDDAEADPETAPFLMPRGGERNVWTALRNTDDQFVGWFALTPRENAAEIGYRLRKDAWGQGLATEGALALVEWGFRVAEYDKIVGFTMAVNEGSRRVMEKIGMRHTRTDFLDFPDPIPGTEHGEVTYELTRTEWSAQGLPR